MNDIFILPLTNSEQICLIDIELASGLVKTNWFIVKSGYVCYRKIRLHNRIMGHKKVDHKNGLPWDNRLSNLRICTTSQNAMNKRKCANASSIYKGVSKRSNGSGRFKVAIKLKGKVMYLGDFANEVDAAKAYDKKAKELFGEFAKLNF